MLAVLGEGSIIEQNTEFNEKRDKKNKEKETNNRLLGARATVCGAAVGNIIMLVTNGKKLHRRKC